MNLNPLRWFSNNTEATPVTPVKAVHDVTLPERTSPVGEKALGNQPVILDTGSPLLYGGPRQPFAGYTAARYFTDWAYAASLLNAERLGAVPIRLYMRKRSGGMKAFNTAPLDHYAQHKMLKRLSPTLRNKTAQWNDQFEVVTDKHPILDLLADANPFETGYHLGVSKWIYLQLFGNAYWYLIRGRGGLPTELWTMPSQYVTAKLAGKLGEDPIKEYVYNSQDASMQHEAVHFPTEDVAHFVLPVNLYNPSLGYGRMEAAWTALSLKNNKREADMSQVYRAVAPSMLFALKGATQDSLERFETRILNKMVGPNKRGKHMAFNADDVQVIQQTLQEFDLGDADSIVDEIAATFRVPNTLLKMKDANLASAKASEALWLSTTITPLLRYDEEYLNERLVEDAFGLSDDYFLAYDAVQGLTEQEEEAGTLFKSGLVTRNEARSMFGQRPVEGPEGDEFAKMPKEASPINAAL